MVTSVNTNKRLTVFDVVKGLGIILVVFAHVNYTNAPLTYIYSFHMPLFFIISGIFFDKKKYTFLQFVKNRFFRLICPYLFFYVLILLFKTAIALISNGFSAIAFDSVKEPFIQMFIAQGSAKVVSAPLWFIPCLFVVEVLYYFISKLKPYFNVPICIALAVGGWLLETRFRGVAAYLPWSIDSALFSIGFYALGNLTADYLKRGIKKLQEHKYKILISSALALLCFLVLIPLAFLNGKISLGSKILNNGFLLYATGIIGTAGIILLSIALEKAKFLSYLGKNSFCIMAVHYTIRSFLMKFIVFIGFTGYDTTNFLHTVIPFFITLGLSVVAVIVYNYFKSLLFNRKKD